MSWRLALLFFALGIVTRLPFQTEHLWAHDSVLYERAIERFAPLEQRPQPPGYLYYVVLIRAVDALTGDANRAMTLVSLFAGAAAIALLYLLAARLYDERTARISALFLLSAVTFWAYAGIAYPYTLLAALSIACALLFWRAATATAERERALVVASAVWAIAIGFRTDLAIFLAPVWLVAGWGASLAALVGAVVTVGAGVVTWYAASALAGGGIAAFSEALRVQGQFVDERYSIFGTYGLRALSANAYELGRFLGRGLYFLAPLLITVPLSAAARHIELADRRRLLFVLAWTLTPLLIYLPIHSGEYGYVFSMLPGFCVIAARGAIALARGIRMPRTLPWIVAAVVLANSALFLVSDTPLSATDVKRHDLGTTERFAYLQSAPDLDRSTIIVAYDAEVAQRYNTVGVHDIIGYDPANPPIDFVFATTECRAGVGPLQGCAHAPVLAVWDDLLKVSGPGWETVRMPHGATLRIARSAAGARVRIDGLEVMLSR
jgi:hypothetical protein